MSDRPIVNLPETVTLDDLRTETKVVGKFVSLARETARLAIDRDWWTVEGVSEERLREEVDRHWVWKLLVSKYQNKPYFRSMAVQLDDGSIQGAMICRMDAKSVLEPGERVVLIDRLATAPWNRVGLTKTPHFRGVGSALLVYAMCLSWLSAFQARVSLFAAGSELFYEHWGFVRTGLQQDEMEHYEIPSEVAMGHLSREGFLP